MKTFLKFKTDYVTQANGCTIVEEEATVDLSKIRAFSVVMSIPVFKTAILALFDNCDGKTITFKAKGVAKCHPDDKFNERKGFHLAQSRAVYKIYKDYHKFLEYITDTIYKMIYEDIENLYINSQDLMYETADHIKYDFK